MSKIHDAVKRFPLLVDGPSIRESSAQSGEVEADTAWNNGRVHLRTCPNLGFRRTLMKELIN